MTRHADKSSLADDPAPASRPMRISPGLAELPDRNIIAAMAEARSLRALIGHASAGTDYSFATGGDRTKPGPAVSMADLTDRYDALMLEWVWERPSSNEGAKAQLMVVQDIVARAAAGMDAIASVDMMVAMQLLSSVQDGIEAEWPDPPGERLRS